MMMTLHSPRDLTVREMLEGEEFSAWLSDLTATDPGPAEERHLVLSDEIGDWVGGLRYVLRGGVAHVLDVGVVPTERGQGHGLRLLQAFEEHARERGAHLLEFWTDRDQAGPLLAALGWRRVATRDHFISDRTWHLMAKRLSPAAD
jgi:GNAT superfamily N-acetyltransferase